MYETSNGAGEDEKVVGVGVGVSQDRRNLSTSMLVT